MKKRTFEEFISLAKKRYVLLSLLLLLIALSGIAALICILFQITLLSYHSNFINFMLRMIWLLISIMSWCKLAYNRNLFVQGKLDWVFGDNIPDEPDTKIYCKNKGCNEEMTFNESMRHDGECPLCYYDE